MTRTTTTICNGCGVELEPNQVGFFGDIFLRHKPDIQFCKGCAALICRCVFNDEFYKWFKEHWDVGKPATSHFHYTYVRDALIEYARLRLGIISGVFTGRDLVEEPKEK